MYATPITLDGPQLAQYEHMASQSGILPNARPVQPRDGRRLNEVDFNINFEHEAIAGLNFSVAPIVQTTAHKPKRAAHT
jgi:hypothetical protein